MKALVIIPTFNEAENIVEIIDRLQRCSPDLEILVVDDGSPDGTADLVAGKVHLLRRSHKQGLGPAYLAGFAWGMERGYELLVEMDADGSHQPELLPQLLAAAQSHDLVIGSRWVSGGAVANWPLWRQLISRLGNLYVRLMLGLKIQDATAGFRVYRASLLSCLDLQTVDSNGYCFQVDLTYRAHLAGAAMVEVPITFIEREFGDSKMNSTIILEALLKTTRWGLRRLPFISTK